MSTIKEHGAPGLGTGGQEVMEIGEKPGNTKNYKGFVAGVFSGIAKLSGEYFVFVGVPPQRLYTVYVGILTVPG